jgi:hypothetical protein
MPSNANNNVPVTVTRGPAARPTPNLESHVVVPAKDKILTFVVSGTLLLLLIIIITSRVDK